MRILMLGAGATGGYFGGRLLQAGRDVSFLVRPRRATALRNEGLKIRSRKGDAQLKPKVVQAGKLIGTYDYIFLSCKAYDLAGAMEAIAPAVGKQTSIVPLLNGTQHFALLDKRFGARHVLGGMCSIAVDLAADGAIDHLGSTHLLRFGERDGTLSDRVTALGELTRDANMDAKPSRNIVSALWEKWVMLAGLAGMNCLMRADITSIVNAPGGGGLCLQMLEECNSVAVAHGHPPRKQVLDDIRSFIDKPSGAFTASMLRDMNKGHRTEVDHILGDLIARADTKGVETPLLRIAYCHMKIHESRPKQR